MIPFMDTEGILNTTPSNSSAPEKLNQQVENDSDRSPSKTPTKKGRNTKLIRKVNKQYKLLKSQFATPRRYHRVPLHKEQPTETPSQPPTNQQSSLDNSFIWEENELVFKKPIKVYRRKIVGAKIPVEDDTVPNNDEKPKSEELTKLASTSTGAVGLSKKARTSCRQGTNKTQFSALLVKFHRCN